MTLALQINELVSIFWQYGATNKWPCVQILTTWCCKMTLCPNFDDMALQINDLVYRFWRFDATTAINGLVSRFSQHGATNKLPCVRILTTLCYKSMTLRSDFDDMALQINYLCPDFDIKVLQINGLVSRFWQFGDTNKWPCVQMLAIWRYQ